LQELQSIVCRICADCSLDHNKCKYNSLIMVISHWDCCSIRPRRGYRCRCKVRIAELELYRMARKKKPGNVPGTVVRIDADLVTKVRNLAAREGVELSAYISSLLRPAIEREFKKAGRELPGENEEK